MPPRRPWLAQVGGQGGGTWARPLLVVTAAWMVGLVSAVAGLGSISGFAGADTDRGASSGGNHQLHSNWSGTSTVEAVTSGTAVGHASDRRAVASGDSGALAARVREGGATPAWPYLRHVAGDAVVGSAVDLPGSRAPPVVAG